MGLSPGPHGPPDTSRVKNYPQQTSSPQRVTQHNPFAISLTNAGTHTFDALINTMFTQTPGLLPQIKTDVIYSHQIDQYTYKMWDWCLLNQNAQLHNLANQYGAMLPEVKLRALAKLNLLPSWCVLRSRIVVWLCAQNLPVEDFVMDTSFKQAVEQVIKWMRMQEARKAKQDGSSSS
jgi:hypothetical protein